MEVKLEELIQKPLWQMTGAEFLALVDMAGLKVPVPAPPAQADTDTETETERASGKNDLAFKLGCGRSTVYDLDRLGVLDEAVLNTIGKKKIFDVARARALADEYYKAREKGGAAS